MHAGSAEVPLDLPGGASVVQNTMKAALLFLLFSLLIMISGCTSDQMGASDNPHPRRHFNAETGNFEGPTPMPPPNR
jgi:hypothetical protein